MNELNAKTKWCPHARVLDSYDEKASFSRRENSKSGEVEIPKAAKCIASDCMAWRWNNNEQETFRAYHKNWDNADIMKARSGGIVIDDGNAWHYQYSDKDPLGDYDIWHRESTIGTQLEGYCGLAGKP